MSPRAKKTTKWLNRVAGIPWPTILFGMLFGYFLSKGRTTDYDTVLNMFLFKDFQLYGVLIVGAAVAAAGLFLMKFKGIRDRQGDRMVFEEPPFELNRLAGGLIFGAGWALTGACPGTALAQLGEGKFIALFTVLGVLLGTWLYMKFMGESGPDCD